jgi:AraC family transcriptional regulator
VDDPMLKYRSKPLIDANGFCFQETLHLEAFEMGSHAHREAHFALILSGNVENRYGRRKISACPMTFAYTPPECEHVTTYPGGARAFYVAVRKEALQRLEPLFPRKLESPMEYQAGIESNVAIRLYEEYRAADFAAEMMLEGLMLQLYSKMARTEFRLETALHPAWLLRARDVMHAGIERQLSIREIAQEVGVHPVHLMRTFRKAFGEPMGSYLRRQRIERVCERLQSLEPDKSIGALALELGFSDQGQMNRAFKKATGMTLSEYRRR